LGAVRFLVRAEFTALLQSERRIML
jgi:hypothetical protein